MKSSILMGICMAGATLAMTSCNDFLDLTPRDSVSNKMIWSNSDDAQYAVNYLYHFLYDDDNSSNGQSVAGMTEALTDQMKYGSYNYNAMCFIPSEMSYGGTTITANYITAYLGTWSDDYTRIRRINENLSNLHEFGGSLSNATRLEAEMRFMRAFIYFDLIKRYKDVILYDANLNDIKKDKNVSPESECWDFVENDLNFAAENLPTKADAEGRIDKGAAYAFLTRAMLYAKRYDKVVAAFNKVKELGYDLEDNYADSYSKTIAAGNKEAILQYTFDNTTGHSFDSYYTPGGDFKLISKNGGGYGTPTQEMVESYELKTGGYPDWSAWHTTEGTTATPPYDQLEPRFQATVLYNGAEWKGRHIESYVDGTDGWCQWGEKSPEGRSTTGYYLRKLVDENHDLATVSVSTQPLTVIRYAEVLLNYAEACYFTGDAQNANAAVKAIRTRVGLPSSDQTGDELFKTIRHERKIELAYEGQWYWDLRRWGLASKSYAEGGLSGYQQHGLKITLEPNGDFKYVYVSVDDKDRSFPEKLYRLPMPQAELDNNGAVTQYPEWK